MPNYTIEDRPERIELDWFMNPSAPHTEEALECFIKDASHAFINELTKSEQERSSNR